LQEAAGRLGWSIVSINRDTVLIPSHCRATGNSSVTHWRERTPDDRLSSRNEMEPWVVHNLVWRRHGKSEKTSEAGQND
jgi:hypothetical protein